MVLIFYHQFHNHSALDSLVSCSKLIIGHVKHGEFKHALALYQKMEKNPYVIPDENAFVALLKACSKVFDVARGQEIHKKIHRLGILGNNVYLGNALINMYMKCGYVDKACESFKGMSFHNVVSWNTLITGYVRNGYGEDALTCFEYMQKDGIFPDTTTFICIVKACAMVGSMTKGQEIHAEIVRKALVEKDVMIGSILVDMYVKCGCLTKAQQVFDSLPARDVVSWNSLIAGYAEEGLGARIFDCLINMQAEGISPDPITLNCSLKACGSIKSISIGQEIHGDITKKGYVEHDVFLHCSLVDMYAKCGWLKTAQEIFENFQFHDVVSWNALITGYVEQRHDEEALACFELMSNRICPDVITYISLLKACGSLGETIKTQDMHFEITRKGLERSTYVVNTLVDVYARCHMLLEAEDLFSKLPSETIIAWNALIMGYINNGYSMEALECFMYMQHNCVCPDVVSFICCLKACIDIGDMTNGHKVHAEIMKRGFSDRDELIGSILVDMYAKYGLLLEAETVFDKLPVQDMVCWTALIAGYTENGFGQEALYCLEGMEENGISPSSITYVYILKACGLIGAIEKGRETHLKSAKRGFLGRDPFIGSSLVEMYGRCGSLTEAEEVFHILRDPDVALWTALITGCSKCGNSEKVFKYLEQMQQEGTVPCAAAYLYGLKACCGIQSCKTREIHVDLVKRGLDIEPLLVSSLLNSYAKCCSFPEAKFVLNGLKVQDATTWNFLIAGHIAHGNFEESLKCLSEMEHAGLFLTVDTYIYALKAIGNTQAKFKGQDMHSQVTLKGFERENFVVNALIDMYVKCDVLADAQNVFEKLLSEDAISWAILIGCYADKGMYQEALNCFKEMEQQGIYPVLGIFCTLQKVFVTIKATSEGQEMHCLLVKQGLEGETLVANMFLDMYAKCGLLEEAQRVFVMLVAKDVSSWRGLIAAHAENGHAEEALSHFEEMQCKGMSPDVGTFLCCLKACSSIGLVCGCREIHASINRIGLQNDIVIGNALVDTYAKCGLLEEAQVTFNTLVVQDIISWTTLITGYAQLGKIENAIWTFKKMLTKGMKPNAITFSSILNCCCHGGLVDEGEVCFRAMCSHWQLVPTIEHYTSMVDLFGRADHVDKGVSVIMTMPFHPSIVMWHTVLGTCQRSGAAEVAKYAFGHSMELDEYDSASYIYMSNTYANSVE